jgi:hypothetical protein
MKKKIIALFFEIPVFMTAGLGIVSGVHQILGFYSTLPLTIIILGLALGLGIRWIEVRSIKNMDFGENVNLLKVYVYLSTFLIYVLSILGLLELIYLFLGKPEVSVFESFTWKWILVLVPYLVAWDTTAEMYIKEAMETANQM